MLIEKEFVTVTLNKHGEVVKTSDPIPIRINVEINTTLNKMCQDLLDLIKKDGVFGFYITHPINKLIRVEIIQSFYDLEYVEDIVFEDYYLMIDGRKIFYNAIFDFGKSNRW